MKQVVIVVPSKFRLNDAETDALNTRIDMLKGKAEKFLGEECDIILNYSFYFTDKTFQSEGYKDEGSIAADFIEYAINFLCAAEFAVFSHDWETFRECRILHKVAEECGVSLLEFGEEDKE